MDFPTLGLNFDLNELIDGLRRLGEAKEGFKDVGRAADKAGDDVASANRQMTEASLAAEAAAFRAARSQKTEEDAIRSKMRQLRDLERVMNDIARVERMQKRLGLNMDVDTAGTNKLVTEINNQAVKINAAVSRLFAPDALRGTERARFQAQLNTTFDAVENGVEAATLTLITKIDRQSARIQGAMMKLIAPGPLSGSARSSRQAELEAAFAMPAVADNPFRRGPADSVPLEKNRRAALEYSSALNTLGRSYGTTNTTQNSFIAGLLRLNPSLAKVRQFAFDARFAIAAFLGAMTLGPLAAMVDSMVALESRTSLYAKRASDVPIILEATFQAAQRARQPIEGIATLYTRLAPLADQLGRSQMQLLRITETVAKAFTIGGAAASEATASAQQFAQAISSNRFGGDELRSVAENAPALLQAIAEGVNMINPALNLNAATFIKWAQAGNATADIMVRALENAQVKIDSMFGSFPVTISQATSMIQNSLTKMVDEVDRRSGEAGMRLSTNIAMGLADFSAWLTDPSTINAAVKTIEALRATFDVLGKAISLTASYFPALTVAVAAYTAWAQRAAIATAWAAAMRGLGTAALITSIQFTAAGGGLALYSGAAGIAAAATARLGVAIKAAGAFLAGPGGLLLALTGLAFGLNYVNSNVISTENTLSKLSDSMEGNTNAFQRAATFVQTYGGNTEAAKKQLEELNAAINVSLGITDDQTRGLDQAGVAALQRAKQEQALTVALLRRAAAEQVALQASLRRSAGMADIQALESGVTANFIGLGTDGFTPAGRQNVAAYRAREKESRDLAAFQRSLADSMDPRALNAQADALAGMDISVPSIGAGDGRGQPPAGKVTKGGKGMAGAINSIAKLRAEVDGLNRQIEDLEVNPLSDVAAKIIAAGNEAAAARTAGKGNAFQDQARNLAMLKEEATIRLELTRTLVEQQRAAVEAAEVSRVNMWADGDATRAMLAYYDGASRGSADYAAALAAQADAQVRGEKTQENLRVAQQFGVTSVSEIARAYKDTLDTAGLLTDETSKYADALQQQAQDSLNAATAAIDFATALERQQRANQAILSRRAEIDDLQRYATALRGGAAALDEYNRQKAVNAAIDEQGPGASTGFAAVDRVFAMVQALQAANDVAKKDASNYNVALAERTVTMKEQLRLATLTARQRQIEAEAIGLARAGGRSAANDNDRRNAEDIVSKEDRANLKIDLQNTLRDSFIQTGKLDFKPLAEKMGASIRQKLYDLLVAKPIDMVINAGVDFISGGIDKLLAAAGPWGQAAAAALAVAAMVFGREQVRDNRDYYQTAEETQAMQGTGTVMGDMKAQSQSLKRSVDIVAQYQNRTLEYSSGMLRALQNIESGIGSLTGLIGRQLGVGGALDTTDLGLGVSTKGPGLLTKLLNPFAAILPGLFGKTTTTNLMDQGLQFNSSSLADILNGGINGSTYQDISKNTTKKFLGVTYSNKTTLSTEKQALDAELATQIGLVIGSLKDGAVEAANVLGIQGAAELLNAMQVNIGRISFKDLDAEGIQNALNAVFGKVADDMASTVLPSITQFQKAGEGAFETLTRVARQYQVIDTSLASIGVAFGAVGVSSLAARERLITLVGGLDEFVDQTAFFAENFLSPTERLAPVQKRLAEEMKRLGLTGVTTRDQFKQLVLGLDLSTEGGATMYAALMDLAPAFAAVTEDADKLREQLTRIFEFAQGLLTSTLSPLSPQQKLAIEQQEYQDLLKRAQGGDVSALEKLTDASSEYLTAAQKYFASSPEYAAIFDKVYQELIALSGMEVKDPVVSTLEVQLQRVIDAINAGFRGDLEALWNIANVLPDAPPAVDPQAGFGQERSDIVSITQGLAEVRDQIAVLGEAVVGSQVDGFRSVVEATVENYSVSKSLSGGGVSQVRKQAA